MKHWNNHRVIMLCLVGVLVISINPLGASAAEFFVATTGNNSNSGTIGSPFLTLERAASVMASGDTMSIRAGTYQRTAVILSVPSGGGSWATATTIKAYNGEKVIITPQNPVANGTDVIDTPARLSWVIFDGLILDGRGREKGMGGKMGFRFGELSHHVRIINTEMRYTRSMVILTTSATDNEFINLNLHHGNHNLPPDDPHFKYSTYGIYMSSGNNLMIGCQIHHNRGYGIHNYSAHDYKPNFNTYIGNRVYANESSGIIVSQSTGVKLINNLVYGNGTGASSGYTGENRYGIHIDLSVTNVTLLNNTTYGNAKGELMLGPTSSNVTAMNNIFAGTSSDYAIKIHEGNKGLVITNNLIYHTNPNLQVRNLGSALVSNNMLGQNDIFVDEKNSDFHLQPGSPARGQGVVLKEVKYDFDNNPRGVPFDIGAYAFGSSSLPTVSERPASPKNVQIF